eukprot:TRINITY_DN25616_c0_g2_i1.p1 TRINITY_DN25616_c0_g2~~TRINITY_DN25616_c0_g2_i1.p1  ORF type:complete len:627 (-),score=88.00 TRINITY_DN25616_c0_g2_i1:60-1679(-)
MAAAACVRGAQRLRRRPPPVGPPIDGFFELSELVINAACCLSLRDVCSLRALSQRTGGSADDFLWERLFELRWSGEKRLRPTNAVGGSARWKNAFQACMRRAHAAFTAKTLPSLTQRARRKDGLPDLPRLVDALKLRHSLDVGPPPRAGTPFATVARTLYLSQDSVNTFSCGSCLRCSFASVKLRAPLRMDVRARSAAAGSDHVLISVCLPDVKAWGEPVATDDHFRFVLSPCGCVLVGLWHSDGTVAGLFAMLHHIRVLEPFLAASSEAALSSLVGKPEFDDIDSKLGLHDYNVILSIHSAKLEAFHNCFYGVGAFKETVSGSVRVKGACAVLQSELLNSAEEKKGGPPQSVGRGKDVLQPGARCLVAVGPKTETRRADFAAAVAHFEVLAPHKSGSQPPFPCLRSPQLAFQTMAFKSVFPDLVLVDATVFDEHGRVFWAISSAAILQSDAPPHESHFAAKRFASIDFDREKPEDGSPVRWICLADRGAAHLVVQLEYSGRLDGEEERPLPRLNSITLHPELIYLDKWWGSRYASQPP